MLRSLQWEDWRDLRFADSASSEYRRAVAKLAARLVEANRRADEAKVPVMGAPNSEGILQEVDDSPGWLDKIAGAEKAFPKWRESIEEIGLQIHIVGDMMVAATKRLEKPTSRRVAIRQRLLVAKDLADQLIGPAEQIWALGNGFVKQMHDVDEGIRSLIQRCLEEAASGNALGEEGDRFFAKVLTLSSKIDESFHAVQDMIDALGSMEGLSRDLRPALRKLRQGLTVMVEAKAMAEGWTSLIAEHGPRA